jgi:hypothetical protein
LRALALLLRGEGNASAAVSSDNDHLENFDYRPVEKGVKRAAAGI